MLSHFRYLHFVFLSILQKLKNSRFAKSTMLRSALEAFFVRACLLKICIYFLFWFLIAILSVRQLVLFRKAVKVYLKKLQNAYRVRKEEWKARYRNLFLLFLH